MEFSFHGRYVSIIGIGDEGQGNVGQTNMSLGSRFHDTMHNTGLFPIGPEGIHFCET